MSKASSKNSSQNIKSEKILVTGGSGYIGSALVKRLVTEGVRPYVLLRRTSIPHRLQEVEHEIIPIIGDVSNAQKLETELNKIHPTLIYHLAGEGVYSYTDFSYQNASSLFSSNVNGTVNLLYALHSVPYSLFVNTGSCFEYGSRTEPFSENDLPIPCNIYGATKNAATVFAMTYAKNFNKPVVTLRPFTVYGPNEDPKRFISTTIKRCLDGLNPVLTKEHIIRDYIYIDDVIEAYLTSYGQREHVSGEILNISTGIGSTLTKVAQQIIGLTGKPNLKPEQGGFPKRPGEVHSLIGNPEKAKKLLDWRATTDVKTGLDRMVTWITGSYPKS